MGWDLSGRLGYFVTNYHFHAEHENDSLPYRWDLSGRLGYFVTRNRNFKFSSAIYYKKLGFERKARLFCDSKKKHCLQCLKL